MPPDAMRCEVYSIAYKEFAPKMLTLNQLRPFDLTSRLQGMQVIEKSVKHHHEETIRQI